ncbi:MAG: RNA polymerase sigma factor [Polyangiaceae bacterium]|nr:RNA polymerase sigma factor [Polyangiaceae bacterium]MBK8941604.1 RNA polymerase sigma factor [Polyangiaceae bacterium]
MSAVDLRLCAARVKQGDAAAFRQVVEHTRVNLYRLAARLMGNVADAEDALQDGYVSAYRGLVDGRYDGRAKLETWLYRIVANACIDQLRKRKPRGEESEIEAKFDGLVSAEARVALRELDAMLATLSPQDRAAIVLVHVEGMTVREAAETLGTTEGAMEQRLLRARAALRKKGDDQEATSG